MRKHNALMMYYFCSCGSQFCSFRPFYPH